MGWGESGASQSVLGDFVIFALFLFLKNLFNWKLIMFCFFNLSMIAALEPVLCLPPSHSLLSLRFDCFKKVATTPRFCGS